jgi:anti-anti-sigma factor
LTRRAGRRCSFGQSGGLRECQPRESRVNQSHPQEFQIRVEQDGPAARLHLTGEMDVACRGPFADAVQQCLGYGTTDMLLDLTELSFIDSSGLRMLIELWDKSRHNGLEISILQGTGQVRRTMEIAGLDNFLPIADRGSSLR